MKHPLPDPRSIQVWDVWKIYNTLDDNCVLVCSTEELALEVLNAIKVALEDPHSHARHYSGTYEITVDPGLYAMLSYTTYNWTDICTSVEDALNRIGNAV